MGLHENSSYNVKQSRNLFACECVHSDTFKGGRTEQTQHEIPILKVSVTDVIVWSKSSANTYCLFLLITLFILWNYNHPKKKD